MAELKALPTAVLIHIAKLLAVPLKGMLAVIELLDGGATVPFIARYRKEATGNLDEVQIRDIQDKLEYFGVEQSDVYDTIKALLGGVHRFFYSSIPSGAATNQWSMSQRDGPCRPPTPIGWHRVGRIPAFAAVLCAASLTKSCARTNGSEVPMFPAP